MRRYLIALPLVLAAVLLFSASALADPLAAPWNGQPISHGIGPTYSESWPVACPISEAVYNLQSLYPVDACHHARRRHRP